MRQKLQRRCGYFDGTYNTRSKQEVAGFEDKIPADCCGYSDVFDHILPWLFGKGYATVM
jgi:hypothetical protein